MKWLIVSDTHLSAEFDQAQYTALSQVISSVDRVILNGDFFDAYKSSFSAFVGSQWQTLFPLLRKKKTIYVYGNHDRPEYTDERVLKFSVEQTYRKELTVAHRTFVIQHGHTIVPDFDGRFPSISFAISWLYPQYIYHTENPTLLGRWLLRPYAAAKNRLINAELQHAILRMRASNAHLQQVICVCGHSHVQTHKPEKGYVNTGFFRAGIAQYGIITSDGTIRVLNKQYA